MLINPKDNSQQNSNLILQTTTPRPIAWIVTQNSSGVINIAPYSLFTPLSFDPPTVIVSFRGKDDGSIKDTLNNIRKNKKCTICMVQEQDREIMHQTSLEIPSNESEAEKFNIETTSMIDEYPPIISSSPIAYFCNFDQEIKLKEENTTPLILEIQKIFVDDIIIKDRESLRIEFNSIGHITKDRYSHK